LLGLVTPRKPRQAVPTLQKDKAAGNCSVVDEDEQLLSELAGGDSLPDVPLQDVPDPEVCPDGSVGEERTCPSVAEEVMGVAFE
jgi:hypothetical protein